jgi:hypothetical protein
MGEDAYGTPRYRDILTRGISQYCQWMDLTPHVSVFILVALLSNLVTVSNFIQFHVVLLANVMFIEDHVGELTREEIYIFLHVK